MQIHLFDDTGQAYDATQCDDTIKAGDILVIPSERVIGIADTWPVAITVDAGNLHTPKAFTAMPVDNWYADHWNIVLDSVAMAATIARGYGFAVSPAAKS